ncbi:hypothetical protein [Streptosporangium saharense]|uniref:hypothetical protein n=1 Tax=Streptosporangium saharense TaxID=1706840 RepID=UPI00341EFB99
MNHEKPIKGGRLSAKRKAQLVGEIKSRGSVAAGAAAFGISRGEARWAILDIVQGGQLIRDEFFNLPDGTIKHVREWAPPDAELAFLVLDDISMERNGRPWGGDALN